MSEDRALLENVVHELVEQRLIVELGPPIKSGKEATVFRCRSTATAAAYDLALKLFRPTAYRSFRNDAIYWEGSVALRKGDGDTRESRALKKGTPFGRRFAAKTWVQHEWEVLTRLWEHGLPVPQPKSLVEHGILMELFTTQTGDPAPTLHGASLERSVAEVMLQSLRRDIEDMLMLDLVHGDLSPYNILWNGDAYRLIDFPQTVDARFNPHAHRLLQRDLATLQGFFREFGVILDAPALGEELWARYQRSLA